VNREIKSAIRELNRPSTERAYRTEGLTRVALIVGRCRLSAEADEQGDGLAAGEANEQRAVAEGNLVAAWTTYEGTQQGPMGPFHRRGGRRSLIFGAVFRIEGGTLAEWWVTWDNMTILRALRHLPSG